ncbi:MAG: tetratricopeptide repeat protein [Candidatus Omnitrophota bacterium]
MKNKIPVNFLIALMIIISGGVVYINSLLNPFIWDDLFLVTSNLHIRSLSYIPKLFLENIYNQDMTGKFYRPVLMSSFSLDYNTWGIDPFGYHLGNILIHLANALMVYALIRLIFRRKGLAFLTAMLFVLHPVQTEAVTYVSGRADPLAAFFCLISLYFFITYTDYDRFRKKSYFGASVLSFLLALLSKESAVMFPFVLLFYEVCFRREELKGKKPLKYAVFLIIILAYAIARYFILLNVKDTSTVNAGSPMLARFFLIPSIILTYIKILLFPKGLHMERVDYGFDRPEYLSDPRVFSAFLILFAIAVLLWLARKRRKEALFGFGWFILLLIPVSGIVSINAFIAEHWLYLPSIGFFLLTSSLLAGLFRFNSIKLCVASFLIIVLAMLGALTIRQNYIWRDPVFFYRYTLKFSPLSTRLRTNLGYEYFSLGRYKESETEFRKAIAAEPAGAYAAYDYLNLGASLYAQGKKQEAFDTLDKAIEANPGFPIAYWAMGNAYRDEGEKRKAIEFYKKAAELLPSNAYYWLVLGNVNMEIKEYKEAVKAYKKALGAYPPFFEARINLGTAYYRQGLLKDAFNEYQEALKINPESPEPYYNIGNISAAIGKTKEAEEFWQETLKKDPKHAGAKKKLEKLRNKK